SSSASATEPDPRMTRKAGKRRKPAARRRGSPSRRPKRRRPAVASSPSRLMLAGARGVGRYGARLAGWLGARLARRLLPGRAARRRAYRGFARLPLGAKVVFLAVVGAAAWAPVSRLYQVVRRPSELFFPVSGALYKTPSQTWATYAPLFRRHSTAVMTPDLLAALAQVEGSGNPVARTYWRFKMTYEPFEIYRPASSAVGMYQITDGTFAEARRYCIRNHRVAEQGAWHDLDACWFNGLYTRVIPTHAIEMTSAYLDRRVAETLVRAGIGNATLRDKQTLAAVVHLCG